MSLKVSIGILALGMLTLPTVSFGEQKGAVKNSPSSIPSFPASEECTASKPCQNVNGEVLRIEESYWIKDLNGREIHMRITPETKMEGLPKVGDKISAQISSSGDANAVMKVPELKQPQLETPSKTLEELR